MRANRKSHTGRKVLRRLGFWLPLAALWALPVVAVGVILPNAERAEQSASVAQAPETTVVGSRQRTHAMGAFATFTMDEQPQPFLAASGLVTGIKYTPETDIAEGDALVVIDGIDVRAHRGTVPFYRELSAGSKGADVVELARYLKAVGVANAAADPAKPLGPVLTAAIESYQKKVGAEVDGVFRPGYVIHFDEAATRLGAPLVTIGRPISAGEELSEPYRIAIAGSFTDVEGTALVMAVPPPYALSSPTGFSHEVAGGALEGSDAEALRRAMLDAKITSNPAADGDPRVQFSGLTLGVAQPVKTGAVTASALYASAAGNFCVFTLADGAPVSSATATALTSASTLEGEVSLAAVDVDLIGTTVVRAASSLPASILASCA